MHTISGYTHITGVIGHNINYTKSPMIHNYWYQKYNIDGVYVCFNVNPENFNQSINGLLYAGVKGINVTVPFKEKALNLCDDLSLEAQNAQSVNCLMLRNNKIYGHNTDGSGFYNALKYLNPQMNLHKKSILILGAGGAASAIIAYLAQFEVKIFIFNRTFEKAQKLALLSNSKCNISPVKKAVKADIIIQTTSIKHIEPHSFLDLPEDILSAAQIIMDINYGTASGAFLQKAHQLGIKNCDGFEMLLQQAVPAFNLFNNANVSITNELRHNHF